MTFCQKKIEIDSSRITGKMMQSGLLTPVRAPNIPFGMLKSERNSKKGNNELYSTSFFMQLYVLLKRTFLIITRDPSLTYFRLITHLAIALFIGILYFGIGDDASNALNNCNYIFFSNIFLMYTAFSSVITTCKKKLSFLDLECSTLLLTLFFPQFH